MSHYNVYLNRDLLTLFRREAERVGEVETGGALAGYMTSDRAVVVTHGSGPGLNAVLRPESVYLDGEDTLSWLEEVYQQSSSWYVGDWHWHRGVSLRPSPKDRKAIETVANYPGFNMPHPISVLYRRKGRLLSERIAVFVWSGRSLEPVACSWYQSGSMEPIP